MNGARNLREWWFTASLEDRMAGAQWYADARSLADHLAAEHGVTRAQACGVIAVLSPRCAWPDNVVAAVAACQAWQDGEDPYSVRVPGVYGANVEKAFRVLEHGAQDCDGTRIGARGGRIRCDGRCGAPIHGPKVSAFYHAINGTREHGAMDIWASRAYLNAPGTRDHDRHPHLAEVGAMEDAYATVAAEMGVTPHVMQAVVWITVRRHWTRIDGRRNGVRDRASAMYRDDLPWEMAS